VEEEANVVFVETKNTKQDSAPERGGENTERGVIINTGKRKSINGYNLVKRGIMPIYINKPLTEKKSTEKRI
jgi:hypothetical protein